MLVGHSMYDVILVGEIEPFRDLLSAHALAGLPHQEHRQEPLLEGDLRRMEHRTHGDGELLSTVSALIQTGTSGLPPDLDGVGRSTVSTESAA